MIPAVLFGLPSMSLPPAWVMERQTPDASCFEVDVFDPESDSSPNLGSECLGCTVASERKLAVEPRIPWRSTGHRAGVVGAAVK